MYLRSLWEPGSSAKTFLQASPFLGLPSFTEGEPRLSQGSVQAFTGLPPSDDWTGHVAESFIFRRTGGQPHSKFNQVNTLYFFMAFIILISLVLQTKGWATAAC